MSASTIRVPCACAVALASDDVTKYVSVDFIRVKKAQCYTYHSMFRNINTMGRSWAHNTGVEGIYTKCK